MIESEPARQAVRRDVGEATCPDRLQALPEAVVDQSAADVDVSTFSRMLMLGLRAGFVVAEGPVLELIAELKRVTDLATSNAIQRALHSYVSVGILTRQNRSL